MSAHKSVAELGVIGQAEAMHRVMHAEREATMAYLDKVTREMGGRRGDAAKATRTGGLIYAHTRRSCREADLVGSLYRQCQAGGRVLAFQ